MATALLVLILERSRNGWAAENFRSLPIR
jgi:hypothetical protein